MTQKRKVVLSLALGGFYALGFLIWPQMLLVIAMAGDAEKPGSVVIWCLTYLALSCMLYPLYWLAGMIAGYFSAKRDHATWLVVLMASIPLLSGLWICGIPFFLAILWDLITGQASL